MKYYYPIELGYRIIDDLVEDAKQLRPTYCTLETWLKSVEAGDIAFPPGASFKFHVYYAAKYGERDGV